MAALPRDDGMRQNAVPARGPAPRRWVEAGLAFAAFLLCLLLRALNLGALPLFFDEGVDTRAAQVMEAAPNHATLLVSLQYGAPPLFSWLAALPTRLLPDTLLAARLTSALIGTLTALAVWAIARWLLSDEFMGAVAQQRGARAYSDTPLHRTTVGHGLSRDGDRGFLYGSLAAILYALCPFTLFYNRMALLDGLLAACGAGALFFALRLTRGARTRDALLLGLCLGAGMLTKIFAVSMLFLPLLAVVAARPERRPAVRRGALMSAALGLLPLVALLLTPQGGGLLSATHAHAHSATGPLTTIAHQFATWGAALWLYMTPPVLLLAACGLWSLRRERGALVIGPWALLGGLPPVVIPGAFLAPRYFLYSAVPIVVLAAYGLVALTGALHAITSRAVIVGRRKDKGRPAPPMIDGSKGGAAGMGRWAIGALCLGLAAIPSISADAAIIGTPSRAPLIPFDRWQYVTGWPSGYAFMAAVAYVRRAERRAPVTLISSIYNPPGDALAVLLGHDRRITLTNVDFATLRRRPTRAVSGRETFVIACRPYGQPLHAAGQSLRLVLHAPNGDGDGGVDVYKAAP